MQELLLVMIMVVLLPTSVAATAAMPSVREIFGQRRDVSSAIRVGLASAALSSRPGTAKER